jgi:NAD(P)-dependent dehydrogenase (short-subunit alcohol dehydrogenase family)
MKRQRRGSILVFTSGLVNTGWPGAAAYAASKGALIGLAKCAALELRDHGVRVNVLSPGLVA